MREHVLALGLTPAVQRTLVFNRFDLGEVNRAVESYQTSAGKAVNTAVALATLGTPACVTGFNGGASGRFLAAYVRARGVRTCFTAMPEMTRTCTTVLDASVGKSTELVEEGPEPGLAARAAFVTRNKRLAARARLVAISGTLPPGTADDFYVPFAQQAVAAGVPVVIDSHREAVLRVLPFEPFLVKLTVRELELTFGTTCRDETAILRDAGRLREAGAQWVFVTHGGRPALLLGEGDTVWFDLPEIAVNNPIGSGDCTTAGFIHAWLDRHESVIEAAIFGLGCGMANALTRVPAQFDRAAVTQLAQQVRCRMIAHR